jgi:hypothetical protein
MDRGRNGLAPASASPARLSASGAEDGEAAMHAIIVRRD